MEMIKPIRVLKKQAKQTKKAKAKKSAKAEQQATQQQAMQQQMAQQQQAQGAPEQGMAPGYNSGKDGIHIKKSKRGTFTKAAKAHGSSVQGFANKVLRATKGKYSAAMRKKANFAAQAAKWKH